MATSCFRTSQTLGTSATWTRTAWNTSTATLATAATETKKRI
jgi:hypothetical protein